jgi:hypothetical protein
LHGCLNKQLFFIKGKLHGVSLVEFYVVFPLENKCNIVYEKLGTGECFSIPLSAYLFALIISSIRTINTFNLAHSQKVDRLFGLEFA